MVIAGQYDLQAQVRLSQGKCDATIGLVARFKQRSRTAAPDGMSVTTPCHKFGQHSSSHLPGEYQIIACSSGDLRVWNLSR
ncbi:hypothetical protein BDR06DRAFT_483083 [Suillus hirtellus]|nr:hypothetical protein BDR06DRAFT_483083 [Suillus hirtellus]